MDFTVISHILHTDIWRESQIISQTHAITRMAPRFVKVPNSAVAMDARAELACYPQGNLYPLISGRI